MFFYTSGGFMLRMQRNQVRPTARVILGILGLSLVMLLTTGVVGSAQEAQAVSATKTKIHKKDKKVKIEANSWNETVCPRDGFLGLRFICKFKTSAKTKDVSSGKAKTVSKIRNNYTTRCSGIGVTISAGASGVGAGAQFSATEATNSVQNTKKSIVDKAGAVTCHLDPIKAALAAGLPYGFILKTFDRYTTGSYATAWINGSSDHTSWAWTW